jgi:hypothetical protein
MTRAAVRSGLLAVGLSVALVACGGSGDVGGGTSTTTAPVTRATAPPPRPFAANVTIALRTWKLLVQSATQEGGNVRVVVRAQSYRGEPTSDLGAPGAFTVRDGLEGADVPATTVEGAEGPLRDQEARTITLTFPMPGPPERAVLQVHGKVLRGESASILLFTGPPTED